jgi:hypothetical protein
MESVQKLNSRISTLHVYCSNKGQLRKVKLDLSAEMLTEELGQYWACAQGRILRVAAKKMRGCAISKLVPLHLLPNSELKRIVLDAWENGEQDLTDSDSDSDEGVDS